MKYLIICMLLILSGLQVWSQEAYFAAFEQLEEMLQGERPVSFKEAVFAVENAFYDGHLNREVFDAEIERLVGLSKEISNQRTVEYQSKDKALVQAHASIYWTLCDSIALTREDDTTWIAPYRYDFHDIWGRGQWINTFVSKLLETRKGNCRSLPFLYKIIAEERGIPAWLALSPNHFYLKLRNQKHGWYNLELTSRIFPIDAWIMASGYVHLDAIRNSMYMDTLSQRENIAVCLIDLAQGYERAWGFGNGKFVQQCYELALEVFPQYINALLLQAETERRLLMAAGSTPEGPGEYEIPVHSFRDLEKRYANIHQLGYRQMPDSMYTDWLQSLDTQRATYENTDLKPQHK